MKNPLVALALALVLAAPAARSSSLPAWAATNPAGVPVRIALAPTVGDKYAHLSWPKVVRTRAGTVVLAYSAGIGHNIGGSGLAVSRSTDGGQSFSLPRLLIRFPEDDARYRDCGALRGRPRR